MICKNLVLCHSFLALVALGTAMPTDAADRIRIRTGGKNPDTVVIDETATPPTLTVSSGVTVRGAPGALLSVGDGEFEILSAGDAYYHVKTRGGLDAVTVLDGPGSSIYWIGVGAESDTVLIHDGPGNDRYKVEGKGGDDTYDIFDDSGEGDDYYYIKGAKGADQFNISDGPGDDTYKMKASRDADLAFTDAAGDTDTVTTKGIELEP